MGALLTSDRIAVIGAGTMGAGIAQVAASAGHEVILLDIEEGAALKGKDGIRLGLEKLITRGKKSQKEVDSILEKITATSEFKSIKGSRLVIEAIVENLDVKRKVFADIEALCDERTIIASNTSSISISALAAQAETPGNIIGMHFFNPAAILKLVEVVSGLQTSKEVAQTIFETAELWGKLPVHAKSTPGFIVNRVARPFYAESLRALTEQVASVATIDTLMRSCGGFKMGPLQLTDLIGQDINCSVTESVYNAFYQDKRFMPSVLQAEMVSAGLLGRKTGKGFYDYNSLIPDAYTEEECSFKVERVKMIGSVGPISNLAEVVLEQNLVFEMSDEGLPRIEVDDAIIQLSDGRTATHRASSQCTPNLVLLDYVDDYKTASHVAISIAAQATSKAKSAAIGFFQSLGKQVCIIKDVPGMLVLRTLCMLVNEAHDAVNQGVCSEEAVDIAMKSGVAYPKGPFAWGNDIELEYVALTLNNIKAAYGEERYRVSPLISAKCHV